MMTTMAHKLAFAIVVCFFVLPATGFSPHKLEVPSSHQQLHMRGAFVQRQQSSQPSGTTTTSHQNWFLRMGSAFMGVIVGIIMIMFSFPVLWLNEKRSAKYEALITAGEGECRAIDADNYDDKNTNWLVHVTGDTVSTSPVKDRQFNVHYDSGVIRLSSVVEIYQYVEEEKSRTTEKETMGGGKTTTTETWYEYHLGWQASYNNGASFREAGHTNSKPDGIEAGSNSQTCQNVEFGRGFLLRDAELSQLSGGSPAKIEKKLVCAKNLELAFEQGADGKHYYCKGSIASPQVGDVRASFNVLSDGPATVVGLQVALTEAGKAGRGGFLPYRVIRRPPCPCCNLSEEQEKQRLYDEAVRDPDKIVDEDMWHGFMMCFCCACNVVQYCCLRGMMPELHHAFISTMSKAQAFDAIKSRASALKWIFRAVGWIMMFAGLCLMFGPFTTALKLFPFGIGSFLSSVAGGIVFVFSFMVTLVVSVFIVAMAYLMYRPLLGLMYFTVLGGIVAGIVVLCNTMK